MASDAAGSVPRVAEGAAGHRKSFQIMRSNAQFLIGLRGFALAGCGGPLVPADLADETRSGLFACTNCCAPAFRRPGLTKLF